MTEEISPDLTSGSYKRCQTLSCRNPATTTVATADGRRRNVCKGCKEKKGGRSSGRGKMLMQFNRP